MPRGLSETVVNDSKLRLIGVTERDAWALHVAPQMLFVLRRPAVISFRTTLKEPDIKDGLLDLIDVGLNQLQFRYDQRWRNILLARCEAALVFRSIRYGCAHYAGAKNRNGGLDEVRSNIAYKTLQTLIGSNVSVDIDTVRIDPVGLKVLEIMRDLRYRDAIKMREDCAS